MVTRIGPKNPSRLYIKELREKAGLTQQQLADRISEISGTKTGKSTISRWENPKPGNKQHRSPPDDALAALAEAFDVKKEQLFQDPDRPSVDALLHMVSEAKQREIVEVVKVLIKQAS